MQLLHGALVQQAVDERVHVVGALLRLRQQGAEVTVLDLVGGQAALGAEQRGDGARPVEGFALGLGEDVHDAGAAAVRLRPTEAQHVDVLAGHRADHVGAGDEDAPLRTQDDHVGEGRPIGRAAGRGAEHDGDLRDHA